MRIAVCDDDLRDQANVLQILRDWDPAVEAECFPDGASLLEAAKKTPSFDMVFLDIYMPGKNGLEIAKALREAEPRTGIVFISESEDHALAAFSLYALHYLVKPVKAEDIAESFRRLRALHPDLRESITFSTKRGVRKVFQDEICMVTSANHAVEIMLTDGQLLRVWTTLSEIEQKLGRNFLKINRGIIVNMDYIDEMRTESCVMQNGQELFLAVRDRGTISAAYQDYLLDRLFRRGGEKIKWQ